jgi:hypothetical protein
MGSLPKFPLGFHNVCLGTFAPSENLGGNILAPLSGTKSISQIFVDQLHSLMRVFLEDIFLIWTP